MPPKIPRIKLSSGHVMPLVGIGLWKVPREQTADAVFTALKLGYRLIDGAHDYRNSTEAGAGLRRALDAGVVRRDEVFVTSKLWNTHHRFEHAREAARAEARAWGLEYLDLFLVHFPIAQEHVDPERVRWPSWYADEGRTRVAPRVKVPLSETWSALESMVATEGAGGDGMLRSIGVSNFDSQLLYDLLSYANTPPAVLQVEHHPYLAQRQLLAMAQESGVAVTAYSTFGPQSFLELGNRRAKGCVPLLEHPVVAGIATRHGRTPAQVLLRWCTQRGVAVIPKSTRAERMAENLDCCGFELAREEMEAINGLDRGLRFNDPGVAHGKGLRIFS